MFQSHFAGSRHQYHQSQKVTFINGLAIRQAAPLGSTPRLRAIALVRLHLDGAMGVFTARARAPLLRHTRCLEEGFFTTDGLLDQRWWR
jgi:hypothetical protein